MSPVGTKHRWGSISTKNIHTTWQATRGSCGQHQVLRPVHVIINNCGQIEQAKPTSVHFTPAWHGSGLGLQRAVCHPSAALWSTPPSGISGSHLWNKPPWRSNLRFVFSPSVKIWSGILFSSYQLQWMLFTTYHCALIEAQGNVLLQVAMKKMAVAVSATVSTVIYHHVQ